ncbi:hypothetical protein PG993_005620 [Apiospora rasikravindrae]|uniref:Uncharacterized protein n=1 Tax=Apiospora rasikravindrae TaxID=990691 RepID=A0ABR1TG24_9PEZI
MAGTLPPNAKSRPRENPARSMPRRAAAKLNATTGLTLSQGPSETQSKTEAFPAAPLSAPKIRESSSTRQ